MDIKFSKRLIQPVKHLSKICGITWSPNNKIIAVACSDRKIYLFDEQGNPKQNISTMSSSSEIYEIVQIQFNKESTKLAIIQSNKIIRIHDIKSNLKELKSNDTIFKQREKPNCLIWSKTKQDEVIFGGDEGNVQIYLTNKKIAYTLYTHKYSCVSISSSLDGKFIISGHKDCSVFMYDFVNSNNKKLFDHSCIPKCLALGINSNILAAGNDFRVAIYNDSGIKIQNFNYSNTNNMKEFYCCSTCNSGDLIGLGNFNACYFYLYNKKNNSWDAFKQKIDNYFSVTSLCWKPDKTALVTGNLMKSVDLFEVSIKSDDIKVSLFDVKQISDNQLVIKNNQTQKSNVIKISISSQIIKYDIYLNNYLVCYGNKSIILGNINQEKYSEIIWNKKGNEEFEFINSNICIMRSDEGLSLIEYGINEVLIYYPTNKKESSDINIIKDQYFEYLILIDQFDKAAQLKENDKDYKTAIDLYIKAGNPLKAESLFKQYYNENNFDNYIYKKIIESLNQAGLSDKSKELMQIMERKQNKFDIDKKEKSLNKGINESKNYISNYKNENLEKEPEKTFTNDCSKEDEIEKAIKENNIKKAIELMNTYQVINISVYINIGRHFEEQKDYKKAEEYYLKGCKPLMIYNMYIKLIFGEEDIKDYNTKLELNKFKNFFEQIENNAKQTPYKIEKFSENDKKIINEKINNFKNLLFNKNNTNLEKKIIIILKKK